MNRRSLAVLVLINAVLLSALAVTALTPPAYAQFGGAGNFMMISGQVRGRNSQNAVYIVDQQSSQMIALMFNSANNKFEYIASRRISDDAKSGAATGSR